MPGNAMSYQAVMNCYRLNLVCALILSVAFTTSVAWSSETATKIRIVTGNLSTGTHQNYDGGEGARILKGLQADVVLLQEFNYKSSSETDLLEFLSSIFSGKAFFSRENEPTDQIPNGILSRFPILESGEWEDAGMPNRDFAFARLDIPGSRDLWAISVHLHSKNLVVRRAESEELARRIHALPATDYVVLGGDFNLTSRENEILDVLAPEVSERNAPTDTNGATTTNMNGKKNYDWILTDADLAAHEVPVSFLSAKAEAPQLNVTSFPNGLVFDSTVFPALSRLNGIQATDSRSPGMQHLAVVKDFLVPAQ
ncbi:MAG: endonuclease/exonuclease/phosphatase family protein [Cryobacterium sp.]|nr:endonuclease/exonuclease/phosphatase family protein [Oligoflexia bacterium]